MTRRLCTLACVLLLVGSSCGRAGSGEETVGARLGAVIESPAPERVQSPTSTSTSTTTTEAPDPWEVLVAVVEPHVTVLETYDGPDGEPVAFEFALTNPTYWGTDLALRVTEGRETDDWLEVQLPVRPNGSRAWIRRGDVEIRSHRFHAEVRLAEHRVTVWDGDDLVAETQAVTGKPSSPTPVGEFYVNDLLPRDDPDGPYGPWILTLSAFSEALETFNGGLPVIAIHGTNNPGLVGQERSNGCIRVPNDVIERLAEAVPLGTPVVIYA